MDLQRRLRARRGPGRGDRSAAAGRGRGNQAYSDYHYVLINRELAESDAILSSIVRAERVRRTRIEEQIRPILESFQI
jgi:guanylate kinase